MDNCQARVPGLKHLRDKLKSQRESQKGAKADFIIQTHYHPHLTFQSQYISFGELGVGGTCGDMMAHAVIWWCIWIIESALVPF